MANSWDSKCAVVRSQGHAKPLGNGSVPGLFVIHGVQRRRPVGLCHSVAEDLERERKFAKNDLQLRELEGDVVGIVNGNHRSVEEVKYVVIGRSRPKTSPVPMKLGGDFLGLGAGSLRDGIGVLASRFRVVIDISC